MCSRRFTNPTADTKPSYRRKPVSRNFFFPLLLRLWTSIFAGATKQKFFLSVLAVLFAFFSREGFGEDVDARMARLSEQLRCLVCQNQTLDDSNADLAADLRREIRAQIQSGRSDEQILGYMVERYGEFVLYRPRIKPETLLLWFGPLLFLLAGGAALVVVLRKRGTRSQPLDPKSHERAAALLEENTRSP